ncbi:acetyltransferase EpsM [Kaistella treverensis]|uniref:Acetyltransferase EpsM n=1 Tax=Kaistella treverensis TaxID=631455 RepID=A0A1I3NJP5_9FLAO|nr:acetyltransferase [Kaistella treverensis]SFJ09501.1 acetyltransferase EpsM [Kaistella treverensis]
MEKVIIIGGGGHAKVLIDCIESENKFEIISVLDDNPDLHEILNYKVLRRTELKSQNNVKIILGIGNNTTRKRIAEELSAEYITAVHPSAIISKYAKIGKGTVIFAGAVVNAGAVVGDHCIINTGAIIEHDCIIEDFVHISPNVALSGGVRICSGTHVGIGANVIQNISIGSNVTIGSGAVVIADIPDNCTAVGIPAKPIKFN